MVYNVAIEVYDDNDFRGNIIKEVKTVQIEAGNRKLAGLKALAAVNKIEGYSNLYKNIKSIDEERNHGN